jgi:multidrug efflux pump subunit AcrB
VDAAPVQHYSGAGCPTYLIKTPVDQYKVIVEAEDQQRSDPNDINRLYFKPSGTSQIIPNQTVTDSQASTGRLSVNHINQFPSVTLYFNLKPGFATGDATEVIERTAKEVLPPWRSDRLPINHALCDSRTVSLSRRDPGVDLHALRKNSSEA